MDAFSPVIIVLTRTRARIVITDAKTPFAGTTSTASLATLRTSIAVFRDEIIPDLSLDLGGRAFGAKRVTITTGAEGYGG